MPAIFNKSAFSPNGFFSKPQTTIAGHSRNITSKCVEGDLCDSIQLTDFRNKSFTKVFSHAYTSIFRVYYDST